MTGPSLRCSANGDVQLSAARCGKKPSPARGPELWCAALGNEWPGREEPPEKAFFARNSRVMAVLVGGDRAHRGLAVRVEKGYPALDARGMILPG